MADVKLTIAQRPDCFSHKCVHGTCLDGAPLTSNYTCVCEAAYTGPMCSAIAGKLAVDGAVVKLKQVW